MTDLFHLCLILPLGGDQIRYMMETTGTTKTGSCQLGNASHLVGSLLIRSTDGLNHYTNVPVAAWYWYDFHFILPAKLQLLLRVTNIPNFYLDIYPWYLT